MRDPMNGNSVSIYNNDNVDENVDVEQTNGLNDLLNDTSNHILEHPNMGVLRKERLQRNKSAMKVVSPCIANHVMGKGTMDKEEAAALCIQRHFRGTMARKLYRDLLYEQFEKEEAERLEKQRQQVEEGEILVDNYHLKQEMEENDCLRRNKRRYEESSAVTIQRVWKDYSAKLHEKLSGLKTSRESKKSDNYEGDGSFNSFAVSPFEDDFYEEDLFDNEEQIEHCSDDELREDSTTDEISDITRSVSVTSEELTKELPPPITDWNSIDNYLKSDQTHSSESQYSPDPKVINRLSIGPDYLQLCFGDDNVLSDEEENKEGTEIKEYIIEEYNGKAEDDKKRDSGCDLKGEELNLEPAEVKIINPKELENPDISPEETEQVLMELESVDEQQRQGSVDALRKKLERFSVRHLDTQIRDLRLKVKEISDELVQELLVRDQLHTKQDALLMDVEDAVKYAQSKHKLYQKCAK